MGSRFIISLDFELLWGVRDHHDRDSYGRNILGARAAVPRILDLFFRKKIAATWATVGFLFCEDKDELLLSIPSLLPNYHDSALSNYNYFGDVGRNENADPYYFAPSLIKEISAVPGQEIGTHTLSHFYCLENGATIESFSADLDAACRLAERRGIVIKSIVFPRNQYAQSHIRVAYEHGVLNYRGNPDFWAYRPGKGGDQTSFRRALRLVDAYSGLFGAFDFRASDGLPNNLPASRFLRPCAGLLTGFHPAHLRTIKAGMTHAARHGTGYHLWWHPHNFGLNLDENLAGLESIIEHFQMLRDRFGMVSCSMSGLQCD